MQIFLINSEVTGYLNFVMKPKKQNQAFVFQARRSLFGNAGVNGRPQIPGALFHVDHCIYEPFSWAFM